MTEEEKEELPRTILLIAGIICAAVWICYMWPLQTLAVVASMVAIWLYGVYANKRYAIQEQARQDREHKERVEERARLEAEAKSREMRAYEMQQAEAAAKAAQEDRECRTRWNSLYSKLYGLAETAPPVGVHRRRPWDPAMDVKDITDPTIYRDFSDALTEDQFRIFTHMCDAGIAAMKAGKVDPAGELALKMCIGMYTAFPDLRDLGRVVASLADTEGREMFLHPLVRWLAKCNEARITSNDKQKGAQLGLERKQQSDDAERLNRMLERPAQYIPRRLLPTPAERWKHCPFCENLEPCLWDKGPVYCPQKPKPESKAPYKKGSGPRRSRAAGIEAEPTAPEIEQGRDM